MLLAFLTALGRTKLTNPVLRDIPMSVWRFATCIACAVSGDQKESRDADGTTANQRPRNIMLSWQISSPHVRSRHPMKSCPDIHQLYSWEKTPILNCHNRRSPDDQSVVSCCYAVYRSIGCLTPKLEPLLLNEVSFDIFHASLRDGVHWIDGVDSILLIEYLGLVQVRRHCPGQSP